MTFESERAKKRPQDEGGEGAAAEGGEKEPKILFRDKKTDESWKEKAQREKEKLSDAADAASRDEGQEIPPASFLGLLEELSLRAMLALGQLRHPATGEAYLDLDAAKYTIDLLSVLEEKTKGNLDPMEERTLKESLQNLRLAFVHVARSAQAAESLQESSKAPKEPKEGPGKRPGPEKPGPKIIL